MSSMCKIYVVLQIIKTMLARCSFQLDKASLMQDPNARYLSVVPKAMIHIIPYFHTLSFVAPTTK